MSWLRRIGASVEQERLFNDKGTPAVLARFKQNQPGCCRFSVSAGMYKFQTDGAQSFREFSDCLGEAVGGEGKKTTALRGEQRISGGKKGEKSLFCFQSLAAQR